MTNQGEGKELAITGDSADLIVVDDPIEWATTLIVELALQPSAFTTYYGTFGRGHEHKDEYVIIHASAEMAARLWMVSQFGQKWCTTYPQERYDEAVKPWNYTLLTEVTVDDNGLRIP